MTTIPQNQLVESLELLLEEACEAQWLEGASEIAALLAYAIVPPRYDGDPPTKNGECYLCTSCRGSLLCEWHVRQRAEGVERSDFVFGRLFRADGGW